ncbi:MAG: DUF1295 domain-containing protein [Polyangiaceae bacterium]
MPFSERFHTIAAWVEIGLAAVTFASLFFIVAPYGRHTRAGWGASMSQRLGWVVMESPAFFGFLALFLMGPHAREPVPVALAALWLTHYAQRTFVFPARIRAKDKRTPVAIVATAFGYNILNAVVCAPSASAFEARDAAWLADPRFIVGAALFVAGFIGNVVCDEQLRRLRAVGDTTYRVPRGGLFELVSSPNYLCEIVEWSGWALASFSLGGLAFALYTIANLAPRARSNHAWYRERFPDYPAGRKALVPFLW